MNLSYFSYATGTSSIKAERNIPETATNMAKPDRPASKGGKGVRTRKTGQLTEVRTRPDTPFGLKARDTRKAGHGEEVEEDLGRVEDDGWF